MLFAENAGFLAGLDFTANINFRRRIVADQHNSQPGTRPSRCQSANFSRSFGADFSSDLITIQDACGHSTSDKGTEILAL